MGHINDNPCRHCIPPKRNEYCHSTCKEYADWRADLNVQTKKDRQIREANGVLAEAAMKRKISHYRRGGKR